MIRAIWSEQAEAELEALIPDLAARARLREHVEAALPTVKASTAEEGAEGGVMWRRVITEAQRRKLEAGWLRDADDGTQPWHYFVFYRALPPGAVEVLALRSIRHIAAWELRHGPLGRLYGPAPALAACAGGCPATGV
jgi:hypothetical protein